MLNQLRKAALVGVGSTAIAVEKTNERVQNLVNKGKLSVEEGKQLTNELTKRKTSEELSQLDREQMEALLVEMNVAQRNDIENLESEIYNLRKRLDEQEQNN